MVDSKENKWFPEGSVSVQWGHERIKLSEKTLRSVVKGFNEVIEDR